MNERDGAPSRAAARRVDPSGRGADARRSRARGGRWRARVLGAVAILLASAATASCTQREEPAATPEVRAAPPGEPAECAVREEPGERWPTYLPEAKYASIVREGKLDYVGGKYDWRLGWQARYLPNGDYLNFANVRPFDELGPGMQWGPDGVPMVFADDDGKPGYFYNVVTLSQFALYHHSLYMRGAPLDAAFWAAVDRLLAMEDELGAFRYPFAYTGGLRLEVGWTSAMAQGHALSVLARAFALTGDARYLEAGERALDFLVRPFEDGGDRSTLADLDPSLARLTWLEEYPTSPPNHTLNGFMFTLLGLLDWWALEPNQPAGTHATARTYYLCGLRSLDAALPYFDLGGFSAYDALHVTRGATPAARANYHRVHVMLLWALATNHPRPSRLREWVDRWAADVAQPAPGEGVTSWP